MLSSKNAFIIIKKRCLSQFNDRFGSEHLFKIVNLKMFLFCFPVCWRGSSCRWNMSQVWGFKGLQRSKDIRCRPVPPAVFLPAESEQTNKASSSTSVFNVIHLLSGSFYLFLSPPVVSTFPTCLDTDLWRLLFKILPTLSWRCIFQTAHVSWAKLQITIPCIFLNLKPFKPT